jgi:hypothetical protein
MAVERLQGIIGLFGLLVLVGLKNEDRDLYWMSVCLEISYLGLGIQEKNVPTKHLPKSGGSMCLCVGNWVSPRGLYL